MGSSTAIVVALARCFLGRNRKDEALAIEDVINKGHSGIDFAAIGRSVQLLFNATDTNSLTCQGITTRLSRGHRSSYCTDIYNLRQLKERVPEKRFSWSR